MKSTMLLTTAIFLMSAPAPDSKTVSELSAGFLAETNVRGLMAAESLDEAGTGQDSPAQLTGIVLAINYSDENMLNMQTEPVIEPFQE